jgi:hypothetical protein
MTRDPGAASVVVLTGLSGTSIIGAAAASTDPAQPILWTAAGLGALAAIYRLLHIGEIGRGLLHFLRDYNGEPARPGQDARPGLPERIAKIERQTHEIKGRDAQLVVALDQVVEESRTVGGKVDRIDGRIGLLDGRVTDHRRRNDEQASLLREELERRANDLERRLEERNRAVDEKLERLSKDVRRNYPDPPGAGDEP